MKHTIILEMAFLACPSCWHAARGVGKGSPVAQEAPGQTEIFKLGSLVRQVRESTEAAFVHSFTLAAGAQA